MINIVPAVRMIIDETQKNVVGLVTPGSNGDIASFGN
jgi:hypothetical protein